MTATRPSADYKIALLGWGLRSIEALSKLGHPYVVAAPADFADYAGKHQIPFISWDFQKQSYDEIPYRCEELHRNLKEHNVQVVVPLFEETVEWAGALNARFRADPRHFRRALLCRNKPMMKRRAHLAGLRVGLFQEVNSKDEIARFLHQVNEVLCQPEGAAYEPIHVKALDKAGTVGHHVIRSVDQLNEMALEFPCLVESHLPGREFSCEAFVHKGRIRFLNISEYVIFEHSIMVPPSPTIEQRRPEIRRLVERLVAALGIEYGLLHPEFFLTDDGELSFGEVAHRIPGGHIFELIERAYGFDPFQAQILCSDPNTTDAEFEQMFPREDQACGHAAVLMVYPSVTYINDLDIPPEIEAHPYFEKHNLFVPAVRKVPARVGNGNHYGTIYFCGEDCEVLKEPIRRYWDHKFYI